MYNARYFVRYLVSSHKDMRVVLREAANSEKTVKRAAKFVTVNKPELSHAQGQLSVTVRTAFVDHNSAGAVHRLYAIYVIVYDSRIHIVLVVIPMSACFPEFSVHYHRGGNFDITCFCMKFAPIVYKRVFQFHTVGQEEREAGRFVAKHKEPHFFAYSSVVSLFSLFNHFQMFVKFGLISERDTLDAGKHLVVLVIFPICTRLPCYLERFERFCVAEVRTHAHIRVFTLLVKTYLRVGVKVSYMLDFIFFSEVFHKFYCFFSRKNERSYREIFLYDFFHLRFDCRKIFVRQFLFTEVNVVIKSRFGRGTVGEISVRVQSFYCLRHNMRRAVSYNVKFFLFGTLRNGSVIVDNFHCLYLLKYDCFYVKSFLFCFGIFYLTLLRSSLFASLRNKSGQSAFSRVAFF